jgi:hypothetical protein
MTRLAPHDGDVLEFYRSAEYSHWGLYLGAGKVVHFNACSDLEGISGPQGYSYKRSQSIDCDTGEWDIEVFARDADLMLNKFVPGVVTIGELEDIASE